MIEDIGAVLDADREVSGREHLWDLQPSRR